MIGHNCQPTVNYGKTKFAYAPDSNLTVGWLASAHLAQAWTDLPFDLQYAPLEDARIKSSSWLARYRHASDVTHMIYKREPLPQVGLLYQTPPPLLTLTLFCSHIFDSQDVIDLALEREVTLTPATDLRFEVAKTDTSASLGLVCCLRQTPFSFALDPGLGMAAAANHMLSDNAQYFQCTKTSNAHMTFNVASTDADVILQVGVLSPFCLSASGTGAQPLLALACRRCQFALTSTSAASLA
jgi:hypothetical protein